MTNLSSIAASSALALFALISSSTPCNFFVNGAANYPLVRESMVFNPLSCNSALSTADCTATTLESIIASTDANAAEIIVPCGVCASLVTTDGGTIDLSSIAGDDTLSRPLNIEGKLYVPSSASATLRTTAIIVQGELVIDPPTNLVGLHVKLVGNDDVLFVPNAENAAKCSGANGECNQSSKAVVVAGGRLDIRGDALTTSSVCKTWTTIKDVKTTDPILSSDPTCSFDGSLLLVVADGTFESGLKTGFQRYRAGSIYIKDEYDDAGNVINKFLHNNNRGNVKDGLVIQFGNHQVCAMRNRMYRMSLRYRLLVTDGSSHSPKIILDHTNQNMKTIAHLDLPSTSGEWVEASFDFLSYDLQDEEISQVRLVWPDDLTFADADFDNISILPILHDPPGPPDVFYVDPDVAQCWASKVGTELLITSNEIGRHHDGWNEEDVAVITSIDTAAGAIEVNFPIPHYKTTELQDSRFATEVAILHRSTIFEAINDNPSEPWLGGHSIILHTTVSQVISGASFIRFGQQGKLGKYPIHFHMAGDHPNSIVSKNLIRNSNQRCVVIHGTDSVLVEENVAYNTVGHCYINENGVEENIRFYNNLGALTMDQPEERLIGEPPESDHRAYTFWLTNANVELVGNVAAGAQKGGIWYETFEHAPHGPYKNWPEYVDFNPKLRPLGSFIGNVVHSSGERGIRMYEPGYKPLEPFTFYDSRVYKNNDHGMFIHGVQFMTIDGFTFADNKIAVRNFNDRTIFKNSEFILTTDLVHERNPTQCYAKAGLQQRINPGWNQGSILDNVTFSGLNNNGVDCSASAFEWYHLLQEKRFIGNTHFSNIGLGPGTQRKDLINIQCRFAEDPFNIANILVEDADGTVGLTSNPGFYTSDSPLATAFIPDATCIQHPRGCALYCDNVCLRNVEVQNFVCGDNCFNHTMRVSDGVTTYDYPLHEDKSDENKHRFEAILPKGQYEITFYDPSGNLDEIIDPSDIQIKLGDTPQCADYLDYSDIGLKTKTPTQSPTTVPLLEALASDTIIHPSDPTVKLGRRDWTSNPKNVISEQIVTYSIHSDDSDLPAFTVKPMLQHSCSIVQGLKVYTSPSSRGKDPKYYKIEGRYGMHDDWTVMSEGPLDPPLGRNTDGTDVADAEHYETIHFPHQVSVFREYRVTLKNSGSALWLRVGHINFTGFFVACNHSMANPTSSPTSDPSNSPSNSPSHSPSTTLPTMPPIDPIHSSFLLAPGDSLVSHARSRYTWNPFTAVDQTTNKHYAWKNDWMTRPLFDVTPMTHPGRATVVQEIRIYRADAKAAKSPRSYIIQGRKLPNDDWTLVSEGQLPWPTPPNAPGLPLTDPNVNYGRVRIANNFAYAEYRIYFPTNGGNCCVNEYAEVQLGGFWVSSVQAQLTVPYPDGAICDANSDCQSGLCHGLECQPVFD